MCDVKEGLPPPINRIDSTPGFTGRIATDQLREDVLQLLRSLKTGLWVFQLILQEEAASVDAKQIILIFID